MLFDMAILYIIWQYYNVMAIMAILQYNINPLDKQLFAFHLPLAPKYFKIFF